MYDHVFAGKPLVEFYPKLKESDLVTDEFLGKVKEIMDGIIIKRKSITEAMTSMNLFSSLDLCIIEIGEVGGILDEALKYRITLNEENISESEIYVDMFYLMLRCGVPTEQIISTCSKLLTKKEDIEIIKKFNEMWGKMYPICNNKYENKTLYQEFIKSIDDKSGLKQKVYNMFKDEEYIDK